MGKWLILLSSQNVTWVDLVHRLTNSVAMLTEGFSAHKQMFDICEILSN